MRVLLILILILLYIACYCFPPWLSQLCLRPTFSVHLHAGLLDFLHNISMHRHPWRTDKCLFTSLYTHAHTHAAPYASAHFCALACTWHPLRSCLGACAKGFVTILTPSQSRCRSPCCGGTFSCFLRRVSWFIVQPASFLLLSVPGSHVRAWAAITPLG